MDAIKQMWYREKPTLSGAQSGQLAATALQIAITQLGVMEKGGANRGPEVNEYLKSVKLGPGYPWCMAFVYWCYAEAARQLMARNPLPMTAGVLHCWNVAPADAKIPRTKFQSPNFHNEILPGDQLIMNYGKGQGHTGIVAGVNVTPNGIILLTIEGNTNAAGSREGIMVARKHRPLSDAKIQGLLRWG